MSNDLSKLSPYHGSYYPRTIDGSIWFFTGSLRRARKGTEWSLDLEHWQYPLSHLSCEGILHNFTMAASCSKMTCMRFG
jgi:hypothetical protein